jgi:hypothetical protein
VRVGIREGKCERSKARSLLRCREVDDHHADATRVNAMSRDRWEFRPKKEGLGHKINVDFINYYCALDEELSFSHQVSKLKRAIRILSHKQMFFGTDGRRGKGDSLSALTRESSKQSLGILGYASYVTGERQRPFQHAKRKRWQTGSLQFHWLCFAFNLILLV